MDYPHWRQFWDALDTNDDGDITQPEMIDYMLRRYRSKSMVREDAWQAHPLTQLTWLNMI